MKNDAQKENKINKEKREEDKIIDNNINDKNILEDERNEKGEK